MKDKVNEGPEHQDGERQDARAGACFRQSLVVPCQTSKAGHPRVTPPDHAAARWQHRAFVGFSQLDHFQANPMCCGILHRLVAGVSLIDKGDLDRFAGGLLDLFLQHLNLCSVLVRRWGHMQCQRMPQRVRRHVHCVAPFAVGAIVARPSATFGSGLQGPIVEDRPRRLAGRAFGQAQHSSQVMHHPFEHARFQPPLGVLIDHLPGRQIIRHHPPGGASSDHAAQVVERFAQGIDPLRGFLGHQRQIRGNECPLFVSDIARICSSVHALSIADAAQSS
jgi:hypothetical protein